MATEEEKIKAVKAACSQAIIDKQNELNNTVNEFKIKREITGYTEWPF